MRLQSRDATQPHQRLVHLVAVARFRPGLPAHRFDRVRIQPAEVVRAVGIGVAPAHYRLGAPLLQWRVIEEGVGLGVERLGRERRGRGEVARDDLHVAVLDPAQQGQPAVAVHRLVQAVVQRLRDQRMIGHLAFADQVFRARDLVREHGGQQVLAAHAL